MSHIQNQWQEENGIVKMVDEKQTKQIDDQENVSSFIASMEHLISSYTYDDFLLHIPLEVAAKQCATMEQYVACVKMIIHYARHIGVPEWEILTMKEICEEFFENKDEIDDEQSKEIHTETLLSNQADKDIIMTLGSYRSDGIPIPQRIIVNILRKTYEYISPGRQYLIDLSTGIRQQSRSKNDGPYYPVCSHPVIPVNIYKNIDTKKESIRIAFYRDKQWHYLTTEKSALFQTSKLSKLCNIGIDIGSYNAKALSNFLWQMESENRERIKLIQSISHLGWVAPRYNAFVPYSCNYFYEEYKRFQRKFFCIHGNGEAEKWLEAISQYRDNDHLIFRIILAASFSSVLVRPLGCLPFIVHIWGTASGLGKTVALMAAASVWANPGLDAGFIHTFNGTDQSFEDAAQFCCDFPLCIDELQTYKRGKTLDEFIYRICEGVPRSRHNQESPYGWRNSIIITGEEPLLSPKSRAGAMNRVIELQCFDPVLNSDPGVMNTFCAIIQENYGWFGYHFVRFLAGNNSDQIEPGIEHAKNLFSDYLQALNRSVTSKQAMSAALLLTADTLVNQLFFKDDVQLTLYDILPYLKTDEEINPNQKAHDTLSQWVLTHQSYFEQENRQRKGVYTDYHGRRILAIPTSTFEKIANELGFNAKAYRDWAAEKGYIALDSDGVHQTIVVSFQNGDREKATRCIGLYQDINTEQGNIQSGLQL